MEVLLHANAYDEDTSSLAAALRPVLDALSTRLTGEYGGLMEHLWIHFELLDWGERRPRAFPFRFQKRVSGRSRFGLPALPDKFNVGHFSVKPDLPLLRSLPEDEAIRHALAATYKETAVLLSKRRKLGGFDAEAFRRAFREECQALGYECEIHHDA